MVQKTIFRPFRYHPDIQTLLGPARHPTKTASSPKVPIIPGDIRDLQIGRFGPCLLPDLELSKAFEDLLSPHVPRPITGTLHSANCTWPV
jgi:hypothetical protein